jgi:hypothetical protein
VKITYILLFFSTIALAQKRFTLTGRVSDAISNQPIAGASLTFIGLSGGAVTDNVGNYIVSLPNGKNEITIRMLGYQTANLTISSNLNMVKDIKLYTKETELIEVEVKATKEDRNIKDTQMGMVKLDMKNLKKIPVVFGESDIIKALTLQPGITTVGEGAGGFNVRGGRVDQNLVLLDAMPLYNTSHLLGFLSSVNSDALAEVSLYKAGIPAQFGGRLASLLDMKTKNSASETITGSATLGIITSKILLEGPIIKKLTFMVAGRLAYPNFVISKFPEPTNKSKAFFYDFNGKIQYKINDKNIATFSTYSTFDNFKFASDTLFFNKTKAASLQYSSNLSKKLSINFSAVYCGYNFGVKGLRPAYEFTLNSGVTHKELKAFALFSPNLKIKTELGINAIDYQIGLGNLKPDKVSSNIISLKMPEEFAREISPYASADWSLTDNISLQIGARYSTFKNLGPKVGYLYEANKSKTSQSITDTTIYTKGQTIQKYGGIEPRISMRFALSKTMALKMSYNKMRQYLHLISNTTAISPLDFWKVADSYVPPQIAEQLAFGVFKNFNDNTFETSIEAYYKDIQNLVEYKSGARLFFNPILETALVAAKGKAYGLEASVQKNKGSFKGSFSYTYSRTWARVQSAFASEQINQGRWFPSTFDKPHNLAVSMQQFLGSGWTFSSNFLYATGRPASYPDRTYRLLGKTIVDYSFRNLDRIPDYHRLDFSLLKDTRKSVSQKKYNTFSFSIYNLYARQNPYSIYFVRYNNSLRAYKLSVLGSAIPSFSITTNF